MLEILQIILPVFVLLAVGYAAVRSGYLSGEIGSALNAFTVKLAVPTLLFNSMRGLDLSRAYHVPTLISFYIGAFICFALAALFARYFWKTAPGESIAVGFCALFSNTVLLGIAISERAYGQSVLTPVFGIISLHAPTLYAVGIISMELAKRDGKPLLAALATAGKSIFGNPLMIGILLGLFVNFSGISLPEIVSSPVDSLAAAALPVALIGIGAALPKYEIKADMGETMMVTGLKLFVHPIIAFTLSYWVFELEPIYVKAAVILAAMPPGMNIYIFAVMYDRAVRLSASVFVIATGISIVTITIWLWLLERVFD